MGKIIGFGRRPEPKSQMRDVDLVMVAIALGTIVGYFVTEYIFPEHKNIPPDIYYSIWHRGL